MSPRGVEHKPERRRPRLPVDLTAALGGRGPREVRVVDLSPLGCLVRSSRALEPGSLVDLRVELPDLRSLRAKARVAEASLDGEAPADGARRFLAGLEFIELSAADEIVLRSFLAAEVKRRRVAHAAPS